MEGVASDQSKSLGNDSRLEKNENTESLNMLKISTMYIAWFKGKLISLFRQIFHVECKAIGFSSPIPKPAKREQRFLSLDFKKTITPPIDSDFFPTQTEIKTSGALSQDRCGCRKELKLKKVL